MFKVRDYRPNDKERDKILEKTKLWLKDEGFKELEYKT
jgi:hypothetical protein